LTDDQSIVLAGGFTNREIVRLPSGGGGCAPSPEIFFIFLILAMVHFGAFWALVFTVSIRRVKQSKSSFVCQLPIGQLSHMADVSSMTSYINTYIRVSSQPVRDVGSKRISFITEGLPWKITVNSWSIQKKTTGTT